MKSKDPASSLGNDSLNDENGNSTAYSYDDETYKPGMGLEVSNTGGRTEKV